MMKIKLDKVLKCWEEHCKVNFNAKFPYGKCSNATPETTQIQKYSDEISDDDQIGYRALQYRKVPGIHQSIDIVISNL